MAKIDITRTYTEKDCPTEKCSCDESSDWAIGAGGGAGAITGMMIGGGVGGPVGAIIGFIVGGVAGSVGGAALTDAE